MRPLEGVSKNPTNWLYGNVHAGSKNLSWRKNSFKNCQKILFSTQILIINISNTNFYWKILNCKINIKKLLTYKISSFQNILKKYFKYFVRFSFAAGSGCKIECLSCKNGGRIYFCASRLFQWLLLKNRTFK